MIEKDHPKLSLRKQCELLEINRNRLAQRKSQVSEEDEQIMKVLDVIYTKLLLIGLPEVVPPNGAKSLLKIELV